VLLKLSFGLERRERCLAEWRPGTGRALLTG
jgi:hypothetical protein